MQAKIIPNPYQVLGVSRLASDAEIVKAFATAMKERKYPPDAIAKARKSLMNPDERTIADYLSPIIPPVKRFRAELTTPADRTEESIETQFSRKQIDRLIEIEIKNLGKEDRASECDRELANLVWES